MADGIAASKSFAPKRWRGSIYLFDRPSTHFAFRFSSRGLHSARRSLASGTKVAAPARNDDPLDPQAASKTLLPFTSVHSMVLLILSRPPFRVNKIRNR